MRYNCFGYSVISIGFLAQEAVCNQVIDVGTGFLKVLYLGRAPRTKETLSNFREKCRVTRHSLVFIGLTSSQRTPGFWGVACKYINMHIFTKQSIHTIMSCKFSFHTSKLAHLG